MASLTSIGLGKLLRLDVAQVTAIDPRKRQWLEIARAVLGKILLVAQAFRFSVALSLSLGAAWLVARGAPILLRRNIINQGGPEELANAPLAVSSPCLNFTKQKTYVLEHLASAMKSTRVKPQVAAATDLLLQ